MRGHLDGLAAVEATVIFRWFNLIETGERIRDLLLNRWDSDEARRRLTGVHPLVTGSYQIQTFNGMDKLAGALQAIDTARPMLARMVPRWGRALRGAWRVSNPFRIWVRSWRTKSCPTFAGLPCLQRGVRKRPTGDARFDAGPSCNESPRGLLATGMDTVGDAGSRTLECEFAKYEMARSGERLKRRYSR